MDLLVNGHARNFPDLTTGATLQDLLTALGLKSDRVAVEHNGAIVPRSAWPSTPVADGDRFEIVHFVGGGTPDDLAARNPSCPPLCAFPVARNRPRVYSQSR